MPSKVTALTPPATSVYLTALPRKASIALKLELLLRLAMAVLLLFRPDQFKPPLLLFEASMLSVSKPEPPLTVSVSLVLANNVITSFPLPASIRSLPASPEIVSLPPPP